MRWEKSAAMIDSKQNRWKAWPHSMMGLLFTSGLHYMAKHRAPEGEMEAYVQPYICNV